MLHTLCINGLSSFSVILLFKLLTYRVSFGSQSSGGDITSSTIADTGCFLEGSNGGGGCIMGRGNGIGNPGGGIIMGIPG